MILYLLILLLFIYFLLPYLNKEGFEMTNMEYKTFLNENIYTAFYTKLYDNALHTIIYEKEAIQILHPYFGSNPTVLITGSKTGHIVQLLSKLCDVTGLDNSREMIKYSKNKYPENHYIYGEYTDKSIFQKNKFTHILCPLFTIYRVNLDLYLDTMYEWIVHKGYLAIVYINDEFNISQIQNLKPQRSFTLKYDYDINLKNNVITETITNKQGNKRINKLELKNISNLEEIAKFTGFKIVKHFDIQNNENKGIKMLLLQKN
jgi:ubiquinone/menaquinone biosynthesis C-methylase UbiE